MGVSGDPGWSFIGILMAVALGFGAVGLTGLLLLAAALR